MSEADSRCSLPSKTLTFVDPIKTATTRGCLMLTSAKVSEAPTNRS